ncbi:uncharacterized protein LOC126375311 [Pectinophora gossypiella]|uniref:uncharacterized protein LOC126375311 n=1 Tax=Pectinophora gossypiella TaxID=13191 RepID=UPI00214E2C93|nr:uncharacterized protein LOC126375311 [Pectinophora gossypiella]
MSENSEGYYFDTIFFDVIDFLIEYEKLPCLWDKNHEHFKDRKERLKSEEILGEKLGILDLKTLRRKIRSVRGTYNTEIRKIKTSLENGCDVHAPKLSWFPLADRFLRVTTDLSFEYFPQLESEGVYITNKKLMQKLPRKKGVTLVMVPHTKKRKKTQSESEVEVEQDNTQDEEEFEEYEELESIQHELSKDGDLNVKFEALEDYESDLEFIENCSTNSVQVPKPSKQKLSESTSKDFSEVINYLKTVASASENEFSAFGRSVGIQLQNMPLEIAVQLQTDIQAHITKTRLEYLKKSSQNT